MADPSEGSQLSDDGWQQVEGEVRYLTLRISVKCEHCGQPIPINGPARRLKCDACLESSSSRGFTGALSEARKGYKVLGSPFDYRTSKEPNPECLACGARVQFGELLRKHGATTTHACQKCGCPSVSYPVPSWLKGQFNGALQIFGGDPPDEDGGGSQALEIPVQETKPVLMACPGCGASLKIGVDAERTTECEYCKASVFIPDALWKTLHPAKTQEFWTISYVARKKKKRQKKQPDTATDGAAGSAPPPQHATRRRHDGRDETSGKPSVLFRASLLVAVAVVIGVIWFFRGM